MSQAEAHCTVAPVTIRAHDHELACITLNSDGSRLASASKHGEFILVKIITITYYQCAHSTLVNTVLIPASVVLIGNRHKIGHCFMICCNSKVVPMQYLLKI